MFGRSSRRITPTRTDRILLNRLLDGGASCWNDGIPVQVPNFCKFAWSGGKCSIRCLYPILKHSPAHEKSSQRLPGKRQLPHPAANPKPSADWRGMLRFEVCGPRVYMGMGQNLVPLVNIKIAGKWMFIPLKMVLIGIDPYPHENTRWRPIVSSAPRLLRSPMQMFPCRLCARNKQRLAMLKLCTAPFHSLDLLTTTRQSDLWHMFLWQVVVENAWDSSYFVRGPTHMSGWSPFGPGSGSCFGSVCWQERVLKIVSSWSTP